MVVILEDDNGTIVASRTEERVLPIPTVSEVNYLAFGIESTEYHIALYGRVQVIAQKHTIAACDKYIEQHQDYNQLIHEKIDDFNGKEFKTLPTYIRNAIDHPDSGREYTPNEFHESIQFLRTLCYPYKDIR